MAPEERVNPLGLAASLAIVGSCNVLVDDEYPRKSEVDDVTDKEGADRYEDQTEPREGVGH